MGQLRSQLDLSFVNDNGNLDFRSRDHLDIDSTMTKALKESGSHSGVGTHTDPNHTELRDAAFLGDLTSTDLSRHAVDEIAQFLEFICA